jgi:hypothetical protein
MKQDYLKIFGALAITAIMFGSALAMVPGTAIGAAPHTYYFVDDAFAEFRIRDSGDGTNPNGGAVRYWVRDTPAEVNTNVVPYGGSPYPGMSDIIGNSGASGMDYFTAVQTAWMQTEPTMGEEIIFIMEVDANRAASPKTYINDGVQIGGVPHGYIWAGSDTHKMEADQIVLPSGSPPTTFFEVLEMAWPNTINGNTWTWAGLRYAQPSYVAGNVLGQIAFWGLLEGVSGGDNDGPWTEVGQAPFGSPINYMQVIDRYYCAVPYFKGGGTVATSVRSLVYSEPALVWGPPDVEVTNQITTPNPHNGNTVTEYVTISATVTDLWGMDILTAEYRVDYGPWIAFPQVGVSPLFVTTIYNFPNDYTEGLHAVEIRGFNGYQYSAIVNADFAITDTTPPLAAWNTVPGATAYVDFDLVFTADYGDFTAFQTAIGSSYFWYSVNGGPAQHLAWNATFDGYGSYLYSLTATIPGGTFLPGDIITYGGQVTDTAATPNTALLGAGGPITMEITPPPFDIPVILGWNLISFPVDANGAPNIVLADAGGDTVWSVVKWYDSQDNMDPWKTYRIGGTANDLTYIDSSMGLWVYITTLGDGYLGITGNTLGTSYISLYAGWNLVGYPTQTPKTVGEALMGTGWDRAEVFDPAPPYIIPVGPGYVLNPGQGFWVHVPSDSTWTVSNAPPNSDPYMVYGSVLLYDGTSSGGYNPLISGSGAPVTVTWWNPAVGWDSVSTTTSSIGTYFADITNYMDGGVIYINATFTAPYNNKGYNFTYIDTMMGSSQQNVVCGVPHSVRITNPMNKTSVLRGFSFMASYEIRDVNGNLARGYFTHSDGPISWLSNDAIFVSPVNAIFDGTSGFTPGTRTESLTLYSEGNPYLWIRVSEGGGIADGSLTPWGEFYLDPYNQ